MQHRPYPKVTAGTSALTAGGAWVATEKLHGANLQLATDGANTRFGKRKDWLSAGESFFGWQLLREELGHALRRAWRGLEAPGVLRVYGELYGGAYPHPEVARVPGCAPVQTGIWYAPEVRFAAFDALWEPAQGEPVFLSFAELEALCEGAGLAVVPLLARGTRSQLRALPVRFASRVPRALGLPALEPNWAEGYVLKPDARLPPAERPAFKQKIPEFDEARFDEAQPWPADARLSLAELRALGERLLGPPRLASARSKVGDAPALVAEEAALDVRVDLEAAYPAALAALGPEQEQALHESLRAEALRRLEAAEPRGALGYTPAP